MSIETPLTVNKKFSKGPPPKIIKRKEPILIRCADCDEQVISVCNLDWISDDGYTGLCYLCWDEYELNDIESREYSR